ncbi:YkgJ family cysteine cluster protein [Pseudomonas aeruginosa]|uniref:YkgJ family cysteine cluster protein n=1 Tax=Pseudomonas aeruginosa TaxID=287 RepID=UPI002358E39B|nr:YkgJ family cysteine cluster protein [Pseudomonas aeruginosa]
MSLQDDQEFARKNCTRIIASLSPTILRKEAGLTGRLEASKLTPLKRLAAIYEFLDDLAKHIAPTPCKKGCSSCCHYAVSISEAEVQFIEQVTKKKRLKVAGAPGNFIGQPCPFLVNGACSIYTARPYSCRRHHSLAPTAEWCAPAISFAGNFARVQSSEAQLAFDLVREMGTLGDIRQVFGTASSR